MLELQKAIQNYYKGYASFPIWEQAEKGEWNYNLKCAYCIGILDFTFGDYETEKEKGEVVHTVKLKDQNGKTFYHKLTYIYLEMPNFKKTEQELSTRIDTWLFFIKNLEDFQHIPLIFKDKIFSQAFETAELAKFDRTEMDKYEYSLKVFRDNKATFDYAVDNARDEGKLAGKIEGRIEGELKAKQEIAKAMKENGIDNKTIAKTTGLSEAEIDKL